RYYAHGRPHSFPTRRSSDLADLDRIFDPLRLPAVAGHGAELRLSEGGELRRYGGGPIGGDVRVRFAEFAETHDGILLEDKGYSRSEEHTSELQSRFDLVCRL